MAELSTASILRISEIKTLQLIDLYYNEECLWNTKIEAYKSKELRLLAAQKIATILDLPNFTAKHVMMKFKNLRNSYSQELKKIARSIELGAAGEDVYVPRVFWYTKLNSFIKPHLQGKGKEEEPLVYRLDEDTEEWVQVGGEAEQVLNPTTSMAEPYSGSEGDRSNDSCKKRKMSKYPAKQINAEVTAEQKSVLQTLKDIQSHLHVLMSHNDDYHDTFGKYIASLLRSLPPQKALALQPKIVSLITDAEVDNGEGQPEAVECENSKDSIVMKFDIDDD